MPVNGVTPTGTSVTASASTATQGNNAVGMSTDDFYKLLIAELRYQDPMQPMDNAKMVDQVAGIRSIEASTTTTATLQAVARQQNYATAATLIGKVVTGTVTDATGKDLQVKGTVTRVTFEKNGQVVLELDDGANKLPLEAVTNVENPGQAGQAPVQQAA
jgi:flagellar basal-body rod modification protein FlgD